MAQLVEQPTATDEGEAPRLDRAGFPSPRMPHRVMVRAFTRFNHASSAVDRLARRHRIPAERVTVVARGLSWRREDTGTVMRSGARTGAIVGAIACFGLYLLGFAEAGLSFFLPTVIGAALGAIAGAAVTTATHTRAAEDPSSGAAGRLQAAQYDVLVDDEVAPRAREALVTAEKDGS